MVLLKKGKKLIFNDRLKTSRPRLTESSDKAKRKKKIKISEFDQRYILIQEYSKQTNRTEPIYTQYHSLGLENCTEK